MKKMKHFIAIAALAMVVPLMSFAPFGGEHFEIYLNKKLVVQYFVNHTPGVKSLVLDKNDVNGIVDVKYSHCGQIGKSRTLTVKDAEDRVVKQWRFADTEGTSMIISCKVKDIVDVQKKIPGKLTLHYSSKELPKGKLLAAINVLNDKSSSLAIKK